MNILGQPPPLHIKRCKPCNGRESSAEVRRDVCSRCQTIRLAIDGKLVLQDQKCFSLWRSISLPLSVLHSRPYHQRGSRRPSVSKAVGASRTRKRVPGSLCELFSLDSRLPTSPSCPPSELFYLYRVLHRPLVPPADLLTASLYG